MSIFEGYGAFNTDSNEPNFLGWDGVLNLTKKQLKRGAIGRISFLFLEKCPRIFAT